MPGMLVRGINPENGYDAWLRLDRFHNAKTLREQAEMLDARWPDLTDPATLGCILHLVREHWGDDGAHTKRFCRYGGGEKWLCCAPSVFYPTLQTDGVTEAECLVKALEMEIPND